MKHLSHNNRPALSRPETSMPRRNTSAMTTPQRQVDKRLSNARRRRQDRQVEV